MESCLYLQLSLFWAVFFFRCFHGVNIILLQFKSLVFDPCGVTLPCSIGNHCKSCLNMHQGRYSCTRLTPSTLAFLCCTILYLSLLLSVFSTIFLFVFSPFHHHHASLVSWRWYTVHLVVLILHLMRLCFSCIRPTVLWLFPCLNLIAHLWLRRKQHCNLCVHYVQHIHNTTEEILILNTLNAKTNTCGHKQRPQTDTQQNPFDINNW